MSGLAVAPHESVGLALLRAHVKPADDPPAGYNDRRGRLWVRLQAHRALPTSKGFEADWRLLRDMLVAAGAEAPTPPASNRRGQARNVLEPFAEALVAARGRRHPEQPWRVSRHGIDTVSFAWRDFDADAALCRLAVTRPDQPPASCSRLGAKARRHG
jgi:hypothetical protein